jgi:CRP/FNR family transcriptional regulator, nitrogen oxide reductase regulator
MATGGMRKPFSSAQVQDTSEVENRTLAGGTSSLFFESNADQTLRTHQSPAPHSRGAKKNLAGGGAILQESLLFRGLSLAECDEIARHAREMHFNGGQIIFREGDPVSAISVLVSGRAKITQSSRSGGEVILRVRDKGEVLGGIGMIAGSAQFVTAETLEPCTLMLWESHAFEQLEDRFPVLRRNIVRIFAERLRSLEQQFLEIANEQVAPRLARTLVRFMEQSAGETRNPMRIDLSREELAQMTGTTPFTVGRLLSAWEERGMLQAQRKSVTIQDPSSLLSLAQTRERAQ